jgi:hypothetical protein
MPLKFIKTADRLRFRELQTIFYMGTVKYPNDSERLEKMLGIFETFMDELIEREVNAWVTSHSTLSVDGEIKSKTIN